MILVKWESTDYVWGNNDVIVYVFKYEIDTQHIFDVERMHALCKCSCERQLLPTASRRRHNNIRRNAPEMHVYLFKTE
jgi:hypothetical protein